MAHGHFSSSTGHHAAPGLELRIGNPHERYLIWGTSSHLVEHRFDVDRQVPVRAAEPPHDAEAQA